MVARLLAAVCVTVAVASAAPAQGPVAQGALIKIVSPDPDSYVSGATSLRAQVNPSTVDALTFFVDGRQVCRLTKPPYECEFDFGPGVTAHQIRVVAATGGIRVVDTVTTKTMAYAETVDVELVEVGVAVTDGRNRYVKGLPKTAFRVFEDGRPQTVSHFASEDLPLDLVLAIDVSSSMKDAMSSVKQVVKEFLTALSPRDRVTLIGFNDSIFTLTRKTSDLTQNLKAVDRLAPWGATSLYDVIIAGVDMLGHEAGRKAMLVFTDGEDEGSHASLADARRRVQASGMTLHLIGQGRGLRMAPLKKIMDQLAGASGGRALVSEKIDDLRSAFTELLQELSNQYLLGFTSTNSRHDGTLRRLKVEVDGHHQVRAREAYRAPDPK